MLEKKRGGATVKRLSMSAPQSKQAERRDRETEEGIERERVWGRLKGVGRSRGQ